MYWSVVERVSVFERENFAAELCDRVFIGTLGVVFGCRRRFVDHFPRGLSRFHKKKPSFSSTPQEVLESTDSITHHRHIQYLKRGGTEMSQLLSNNYNSLNSLNLTYINTYVNPTVADDRSNILTWLSPIDPKFRHQDIRDRRIEDVGNGFYKLRSLEAGTLVVRMANPIKQSCFVTEIRVSAKHILGNMSGPEGAEAKFQVLTNHDISSLVVNNLCSQARGRNTTIACFYFDFAIQSEQSSTRILGSLLKQLVSGLEEIPDEISDAYQDRRNAIGGQGLQISDILNMLQITAARKRAFLCIDGLDECAPEHRVKLLDSLGQLLQQSPGTRIFVTGRPHILPEIAKRLGGRVESVSISPRREDIITYLRSRLAADTTPDAMDSTLEEDILKRIPGDISEMYVEATAIGKLP